MTNWPNIQEYRNFEAKFTDDPKHNIALDSVANSDLETVIRDEYTAENYPDYFLNNQKPQNPESKIVRCVIKKDFEETFKKVEREDGVSSNHECVRSKPLEPAAVDRSLDKIRLQNHLKWKKQKEEEYLQKKEAEKVAQQKKKEEELRLEKARKEKEKERAEKLRMWQEQKAREKEEKKKEKMVIKMLEEEFKVSPAVDKEKLIEEWVKLKNKQKQIEAEKKAEQLKKEEENRALRQSLAEMSYREWKERAKGRLMRLPKNGYQIFGPKPVPVVKEDWNHDFSRSSPRSPRYSLRSAKSRSTTALTLAHTIRDLEDFSRHDMLCTGDVKSRSPSFYQLKKMKSGSNFYENNEVSIKGKCEMPLKELQPGTVNLKKKAANKLKPGFGNRRDFAPLDLGPELDFYSKYCARSNHPENYLKDFLCFHGAQGDQNRFIVPSQKKTLELLNTFPDPQLLPNKKKIDLYINTCPEDVEENSEFTLEKKQTVKSKDTKIRKDGKIEKTVKKVSNQSINNNTNNNTNNSTNNNTNNNTSKEAIRPQNRTRSLSLQKFEKNTNLQSVTKKTTEPENVKVRPCRRSQSCEKSVKKVAKSEQKTKDCSSSNSMVKVTETVDDGRKNLTKSRTIPSQKRKIRKVATSKVTPSKSEKKLLELDYKNKKKIKRKSSLSKSFSFIDSPYCASSSKTSNKVKAGRRKSTKDVETKSDEGGHCRKISTTKI